MNIAVKQKHITEHQKLAAILPDNVIVGAIEYAEKITVDANHTVKHEDVLNVINIPIILHF